jgi:RND family efflux transporter MFP subunit
MSNLKDELAALRIDRSARRSGAGRWVLWLAILVVVAAAGVGSWQWATRERPVEVETAAVTERAAGTQAAVLNASGYVTARRRATVSSKITGKVVEVNVDEGMAVKEGQVLARLDDVTLRAALALAEAQVEATRRVLRETEVRLGESKVTLGRRRQLAKDGLATGAELDAAEAEVASFEARLAAAHEQVRVAERQVDLERTNLDSTIIRAPFTGVAISKDAQPGEMVSPVSAGGGFTRTGICTIVDMASLEVEVDVNESYINRVRPRQAVAAVLNAYPDVQFPAHVITTVPAADRQKATVLVRIGFDRLDPRILPDMGVKVTFLRDPATEEKTASLPVTLVPKAALKTEGQQTYAFVVNGGTADRRAVKVGGNDGDRVEVLAGLQAGERVVVSPPPTLTSGAPITVK